MNTQSTTWAVYPHSIENHPTGRGYVAREVGADHYNYGSVEAIRVYKRKVAAENMANDLTFNSESAQ